jgi:DNA helicase-2/ATP-dependent DNA helicase PcrA
VQLRPVRPVGPVPSLDEYADDVAEAAAVADAIAALRREGMPAREIAVLFRVNAQSEELEAALAQRGIPVVLRGAERFFDRPEVKEAVTRLRGAARAGESGADLAAEVRAVLSGAGWTPDPPSSTGAQRERWESLAALVDLADERASALQEQPSPLRAFIDELDARAQLQHAPQADGVTLASLHAAKGLEWDAVFIVGCSEGLLPLTHATTAAQIEEERRLCYVGVTRAREQLRLSWAASRQPGGRANRSPSRFLAGVLSDGEGHGGTARGSVKRGTATRERKVRRGPAKCAVCGKALVTGRERTIGRCRTCPSGADERLFDQLKAWRLAEATTRAVPAYVIFTDATLEALASRRPSSIDELADVPGIGPAKLERYAQQLLDLLR